MEKQQEMNRENALSNYKLILERLDEGPFSIEPDVLEKVKKLLCVGEEK